MLAGEYSINAKLLYGFLLNRTMLSQKSGWVSEDGNVYVIYTIKQMANDLDRSERTVKTALRELENAGLITRIRQGWNQANRIFLQILDMVQVSSRPEGNICPMDVQDSSPCMGQKLPASNTDTEYKEHMRPDLLILDDLEAERNTSFGKERVFDVVDKRLLTGKPMIVTTNIPLSVMKQAADLDDRRIFDRILEVCVPIRFDGENFRKGNASANIKKAAEMLNG